jgi:molecular chaperone GrpE (heat shock protein)
MGWGSSGTPPWVDEEHIDEEKNAQKDAEYVAKIKALEKENETLKKRIRQLEDKLKKAKKWLRSIFVGWAVVKGRLKRKISTAGKKPIVYLPEDMVKAIDEKVGDEVDVYVKGKKSWSKKLDFEFLGSMASCESCYY